MTPDMTFQSGSDAQDRAETLDETHLTKDGRSIANFDQIPDVFDATSADDDDDIDGYEDEEFDPDEVAATLQTARDDEGMDIPRDPAALAGGRSEDDRTDAPSDPSEKVDEDADPHVDKQLDKGLKETFPASDPVSINPGAD
ncbi:MAG TPA: primosomal protein [Caulobacter sp.]|nr:primosomal protein [Caulobacter sp.]